MTDHPLPPSARHLELLATADVDIEGRMPWSSNATFLVNLSVAGEQVGQAIYKPLRGERPLWDFEPGLHRRELAAYRLSEAMGIDLVPPTIIRDGPLGEGSLQWFVESDHQQHYFTIYEKLIALLSGGHVLIEGVPGTAKTLMAKTLATLTRTEFKRVQFTPDMMPSRSSPTLSWPTRSTAPRPRPRPPCSKPCRSAR